MVGLLLRHGGDAIVDHQDRYDGWTALHRAAAAGSVQTIGLLLEHGAAVNTRTGRSGETALHLAAARASGLHVDAVRFLLGRRADLKAVDAYGVTGLQHALQRGDGELAALLRDAGASEPTALPTQEQTTRQLERDALSAVRKGSLRTLTALLGRHPALVNAADHFGQPLLCLAARRDDLRLVRFLVERGADVTRHDPIHYAGQHGHREMCRLLVERGGVDHLVPDGSPAARALFHAAMNASASADLRWPAGTTLTSFTQVIAAAAREERALVLGVHVFGDRAIRERQRADISLHRLEFAAVDGPVARRVARRGLVVNDFLVSVPHRGYYTCTY